MVGLAVRLPQQIEAEHLEVVGDRQIDFAPGPVLPSCKGRFIAHRFPFLQLLAVIAYASVAHQYLLIATERGYLESRINALVGNELMRHSKITDLFFRTATSFRVVGIAPELTDPCEMPVNQLPSARWKLEVCGTVRSSHTCRTT